MGTIVTTALMDKLVFRTLIALILLSPFPFASIYPWSWGLIVTVTGALLAVWGIVLVIKSERPAVGLGRIWLVAALFLVPVIWAGVQSAGFSPLPWHHPLWNTAAAQLGMDVPGSISLDPAASQWLALRLLAYGGVFWLSLQYCRSAERARRVMFSLTLAGLAYALYGLIVEASGTRTVLWYDKFTYLDDLTSTFINRNSYATYAGLTLICASGLLLKMLAESLGAAAPWRERLRRLAERMTSRGWILVVACAAIFMALLLTHSRAGLASSALGLIVLCLVVGATKEVRFRFGATIAGLILVVGAGFFAVGGEVTDQRLARLISHADERPKVYALTREAIETAPLLGTGYGTFEDVFRFHRTADIGGGTWAMAHSTYLENSLELGIPAAVSLFASIAGLGLLCLFGVRRRRRDSIYPAIGVAATVLVAAHSTVDFSLQIPAVALTYSLIMGAACAQSWSSRRSV